MKNLFFFRKKETPIKIENDIYNVSLQTINDLQKDLQANEYYLTNPKLDFLTNLLQEQIKKRNGNARGSSFRN